MQSDLVHRFGVVLILAAMCLQVTSGNTEIIREVRFTNQDYPVWTLHDTEPEVFWLDWNEDLQKEYETKWTEYLTQAIDEATTESSEAGEVPFPVGTQIELMQAERYMLLVRLNMAGDWLTSYTERQGEAISDWGRELMAADSKVRSLKIVGRAAQPENQDLQAMMEDDPYGNRDREDYQELAFFLRVAPPLGKKPFAERVKDDTEELELETPIGLEGRKYHIQPKGALSGASIFVNPGHGWLGRPNNWITQRGVSHGLIEDHSNAEAVLQFLVPYLWQAGARVYTCRERDLNPNMVIVEHDGEGYSEWGDWEGEEVEGARGGTQRSVAGTAKAIPSAAATFTADIPKDDHYAVYIWYTPTTLGKAARDARVTIKHSGGESIWRQDQRKDGATWKYVGTFYFEADSNEEHRQVVIDNVSAEDGRMISVDAVRFGGGMGDQIGAEGGTISGHPRWEESGLYYAEFKGYNPPESDFRRFNSVSAMGRLAEWEMEDWEEGKTIYVSWHTNASATGQSRGLSTFIYGMNGWGPLSDFCGFPGSKELMHYVHDEILSDVRATVIPDWKDAGKICRWLGETNPHRNKKMPAALFEMGFHDNAEDAAKILDPQFRKVVSRAVMQGIVNFYANEMDGFDITTQLPEPPTHFYARYSEGSWVEFNWSEPPYRKGEDDQLLGDRATSYRLYKSLNGKGFDGGRDVPSRRAMVKVNPGETAYFRVTAVNDGGESFPSETLCVRWSRTDRPRVLVVNGFDRLDRAMNLRRTNERYFRVWERGIISKMNTFDYSIQHAQALDAVGCNFDSTSNEALGSGRFNLSSYDAIVWILGKESGETEAMSEKEQEIVSEYLKQGGSLFVSGSDLGWDLDGADKGRAFYRDTLSARYMDDDAVSNAASGAAGSIFDGLGSLSFGSEADSVYPVVAPDVIQPEGNAKAALHYEGTSPGRVAAIQANSGEGKLVYLAFPFETIEQPYKRHEIMARAIDYLTGE
jgi:N-acetylmuramoyl-L-alanine amidase